VVYASFAVLEITAKHLKPFTDGEFVKECLLKATKILCPEEQHLFKITGPSANSVTDCVNDLAGEIAVST